VLGAGLYHKTGADSLAPVLAEGLKCGEQGRHSREERVPQTNELLNRTCPEHLRRRGLDRHRCAYCYLAVDGRIFDVDSGRLLRERDWRVGEGMVKLRLAVDPAIAYVSDLEAYDELAARLDEAPERTLRKLAQRYWERIVPLPDLCAHYRLQDHTLVRASGAPARLPGRLERVEVLLTADVPAHAITHRPG
jgi:hypothetical protein